MLNSLSIVEVLWVDFCSYAGWKDEKEVKELIDTPEETHLCQTVGYWVDSNDDRLLIATSINAEGDLADFMWVPISQVKKFDVICKREDSGRD